MSRVLAMLFYAISWSLALGYVHSPFISQHDEAGGSEYHRQVVKETRLEQVMDGYVCWASPFPANPTDSCEMHYPAIVNASDVDAILANDVSANATADAASLRTEQPKAAWSSPEQHRAA